MMTIIRISIDTPTSKLFRTAMQSAEKLQKGRRLVISTPIDLFRREHVVSAAVLALAAVIGLEIPKIMAGLSWYF